MSHNKLKTLPDLSSLTELREVDSLSSYYLLLLLWCEPFSRVCFCVCTVSFNHIESAPKWLFKPLLVIMTGNPIAKEFPQHPCSQEIYSVLRARP